MGGLRDVGDLEGHGGRRREAHAHGLGLIAMMPSCAACRCGPPPCRRVAWAAPAPAAARAAAVPRAGDLTPHRGGGAPRGLTFDDGPHRLGTPAVLRALAEGGARATFFVVGEQVRRDPGPRARRSPPATTGRPRRPPSQPAAGGAAGAARRPRPLRGARRGPHGPRRAPLPPAVRHLHAGRAARGPAAPVGAAAVDALGRRLARARDAASIVARIGTTGRG